MIKKIEQYLLTQYPIIWNIKIVPVVLLVIAVQLLLFAVGYGVTDTVIDADFYSSDSYFLIYAGAVLTAILIFIFWIVQYNRNNGLKAHYPQSNASLFVEWLMIFGICSIISFTPNALSLGKERKWKSTISEKQYTEAVSILTKTKSLHPDSEYDFEIRDQKALLVGDADVDRTKFDTRLYTYEEDAIEPNNPIEYVGPSLLYYAGNHSYRYHRWNGWEKDVDRVHQWLVAEKRDSIEATIQAFLELHKFHNLKTNIDVDSWMDIVYHPPLYPLPEGEVIVGYESDNLRHYTQYHTLENYYHEAGNYYGDNSLSRWHDYWHIIITLMVGMGLSVMVFSARVTSGRSWIFALLASGVIIFVLSILSGILSLVYWRNTTGILVPLLLLTLLAVIGITIVLKVMNRKKKGRSNVYINLGLWLVPAVLPLCYLIYTYVEDLIEDFSDSVVYIEKLDSSIVLYNLFSANIIFTIAVMFPVVMLIRRWKALPED